VFETALAVARALSGHLDFYHVRVSAGEAAMNTPHVAYVWGTALRVALEDLQTQSHTRAAAARMQVESFCARNGVPMIDEPCGRDGVSASWREEEGNGLDLTMLRARHSDLVVMGRHTKPNGLPPDLIELVLLRCGRPVIVAPASRPRTLTGTVMVCWKETPEAARALAAALPLLEAAQEVILMSARDDDGQPDADDLVRQMAWHGIHPRIQCVNARHRSTGEALMAAARDVKADLVVMGGYGHTRMRQIMFGGCTQGFLENRDHAVFITH
jgi:nucleotide-binding universal stress UspA family protein